MASMEYKGYIAVLDLDIENGIFHGSVVNTRDVITFEGSSVGVLRREFEASVNYYLELCAKQNREPEKPASGKFVVRIAPEMHRELIRLAARESKSLNTVVRETLQERVQMELASQS
jgi:predicted HicB family RNase H-like nuclease